MNILLGIDTGGTFTDFVLLKQAKLSTHKVLSTPAAPEQAILQGVRDLGLDKQDLQDALYIVHGSTVATNAVLEGKGVRTVFISNNGVADMLAIARQARPELYNLQPAANNNAVAVEYCIEVDCRVAANGEVITELTDAELARVVECVKQAKPAAVAINLLFSFLNNAHEKRLANAMRRVLHRTSGDAVFISCSSDVLPEVKEYERGMTTWLNASVGPLVQGYLLRLQQALPQAQLAIMQSTATTVAVEQAGNEAVRMLLSGPAGGLAAAAFIQSQTGQSGLLTFDMGGTSTDVALVENKLQLTNEASIAGYPVAVPMLDMHTVGAGGGSIASIDAGGLLQVGPQSAGAQPGPVCYGKGGRDVTVTDANLVLGRLLADAFLGGAMTLDEAAARQAIAALGKQLGLSIEETASGIIQLANDHMSQALRVMSVQRGIDPRRLTLMSFGGAGGLHVCALAQSLQMERAIIPMHSGVLSALGMLIADKGRHLSHTINRLLVHDVISTIEQTAGQLIKTGTNLLEQEGVITSDIQTAVSLDCRYQGQSATLNIKWQTLEATRAAFHHLHQQRYGHDLELPIEVVNVRVAVTAPGNTVQLPDVTQQRITEPVQWTKLAGEVNDVPVYAREQLAQQQVIEGPALITETVATSYIAAAWQAEVDVSGNILLTYTG